MKKFLLPGILAVFVLFLPSISQAWPLDVPYEIVFDTTNVSPIVISTTNFPSPVSAVNANIASYSWCIEHINVSGQGVNSTFTMAWSTAPLTQVLTKGTTDFQVVASTLGYDTQWSYRTPYCAPQGGTVLTLTATAAGSQITAEGYLWKGWNGGP